MVEFKVKGRKYTSVPIKWEGKKIHFNGERTYDSDKLNIPYEEIKKQLGPNIIWDSIEKAQ